jgi:hypothetical protein
MKGILKNPIVATVVGTVISTFILKLIDLVFGTAFLVFVWDKVKAFFSLFTYSFDIPVWGIILIVVLSMIFIVILDAFLNPSERETEEKDIFQPIFDSYKEDTFNGILYRWDFIPLYDGKYDISRITVHCSNCKCLVHHSICPSCKTRLGGYPEEDYQVKALIAHKVEMKMEQLLKSPPSL